MTLPPEPTATARVPHVGRPDVENLSVGDLMGNVSRDLSTLLRQELTLAKAELKVEAGKAGRGTGMLAGAGIAGWMVLLFLSIALWAGLSNVMDAGWAGLIVAVLWGVIGAVLYSGGRRQLRQVNPKPEQTAATLKNVPDALKGH
jgi:Putative Actinobacterial Holin-X, holin superfamily III